jgi:hypothetical protein
MSCANRNTQKLKILMAGCVAASLMAFSAWSQADTGIKINEIFPRATETCPEWIEVFNTGAAAVNLRGWSIGRPGDSSLVSAGDAIVPSGGFLVITRDTFQFAAAFPAAPRSIQPLHWQSLDNYHDTVMLWNFTGSVIDSAGWDYKKFSGWTNQSLSRVSLRISGYDWTAWVLSQNPTPGQPNPEAAWHAALAGGLEIGPVPFTPNSDGKDDYLSIRVALPPGATASFAIYGLDGRKYYEVASVSSQEILWTGKSGSGALVPNGPFFVVAEIKGTGTTQVIRKKGILWR